MNTRFPATQPDDFSITFRNDWLGKDKAVEINVTVTFRDNTNEMTYREKGSQPYPGMMKVYVWDHVHDQEDNGGYNPVADILSGYRYNMPYLWWKTWMPSIFMGLLDLNQSGYKFAWHQRCGCTCPCSPGFLLTEKSPWGEGYDAAYLHYNCNITVNSITPVAVGIPG